MIDEATSLVSLTDTLASYTGFLARANVSQSSYEFLRKTKKAQILAPKVVWGGEEHCGPRRPDPWGIL